MPALYCGDDMTSDGRSITFNLLINKCKPTSLPDYVI